MLSKQQNEYLTNIGPGTPMGKLLRAYWIPLLYTPELAENDGAPVRIRLLGESLVAFRDSSGRVGLLDQQCPHRLASLFYGRNEDNGLRCLYHGWKFDVDGRCTDIPNEPDDCPLLNKVGARAYPCREANGIIWTYMGSGAPPMPTMGWAKVPCEQKSTLKYMRHCNWVQAMEGDFDSSHLGFLHQAFDQGASSKPFEKVAGGDALRGIVALDKQPKLEVEDTPVGVMYGACRETREKGEYWRITQFQLPFYTSVPAYNGMNRLKIWVPMDDTHTMVWEANWTHGVPLSAEQRKGWKGRVGPSGMLPDGDDWYGRGRFVARAENDYLIDRERQKHVNFSGMEDTTPIQDGAMQESMGALVDRRGEHLSASDAAIIKMRQRLLRVAESLDVQGVLPPGVQNPDLYNHHGEQVLLGEASSWKDSYERLMKEQYDGSK
jgi:phenylpropionate dioxygenase-like ring-hydroxylating dioxygenase large terminal subunit